MLLPVAISSRRRIDGWMDGSRCDSLYYIIPEELLQLVLNSYADVMMMMVLKLLKLLPS